ncbi:MAG: hypothetical protein AAFU85_12515 [Planctomycetota bacterium]
MNELSPHEASKTAHSPVNPYDASNAEPRSLDSSHHERYSSRSACAAIGTATSIVALYGWMFVVIHYINEIYSPNMGFWQIILCLLCTATVVPLGAMVFLISVAAPQRFLVAQCSIASVLLVAIAWFLVPLLDLAPRLGSSRVIEYGCPLGILFCLASLVGLLASGIAGLLDTNFNRR